MKGEGCTYRHTVIEEKEEEEEEKVGRQEEVRRNQRERVLLPLGDERKDLTEDREACFK